ncbi:MAG: hypothetical protein HUJ56_03345, partial [Erysipelotrichaceae bacterium]|nr:hypothetical protein [Erysipelotrichaceae bacterium]
MKKSLLVAAVLLSIGSGCLLPREVGAIQPQYYWDKEGQTWVHDVNKATATDNKAVLPKEGFTVSEGDYFYAGYSNGDVKNNSFNVENLTTTIDNVVGGYSLDGNAVGNTVAITGSSNVVSVYGGHSEYENAEGNAVTISDSSNAEYVYGAYSYKGNATSNTVTISGGDISGEVYGGFSTFGNAEGNTVIVNGGNVNLAIGGYSEVKAFAQGNEVIISNSTGKGYVGDVIGGSVYWNEEEDYSLVKDNIVTWKDGEIKGNIYGVTYYDFDGDHPIEGSTNILNVYHSSGSNAKTIAEGKSIVGFDRMNFYLSGDVKADSVI